MVGEWMVGEWYVNGWMYDEDLTRTRESPTLGVKWKWKLSECFRGQLGGPMDEDHR